MTPSSTVPTLTPAQIDVLARVADAGRRIIWLHRGLIGSENRSARVLARKELL